MLKKTIIIVGALFGVLASSALADNSGEGLGADLLIQSTDPVKDGEGRSSKKSERMSIKLDNPLAVHFYNRWEKIKDPSFQQTRWARLILEKKWEKAAHLWSVTKRSVDDQFAITVRAAYLFALWKLKLGQSFWNEWFEMLRVKRFRNSEAFTALNLSIQEEIQQHFYDWAIEIEATQAEFLFSEITDKHPLYDTIRAHVLLRNVAKRLQYAEDLFFRLPDTHPYYVPLAKTLALQFARIGNLGKSGSILKRMEGHILSSKNPENIASYYLQIARLLYQSGNFAAARSFYQKVPKGSENFLAAREELAWVLLQMGEFGALRGGLQTFRMDIWKDRFLPEIHLVSAIGNLKLCFYSEVKKDFTLFLKKNRRWAKRIEEELKKPNPSKPTQQDFYIKMAEKALSQRLQELKVLEGLAKESLAAALPAVGVQPHWKAARKTMESFVERARKRQAQEYRRVWRSYRFVLQEAIRKMRFVKVELMGQLSQLASSHRKKKLKGNIKTKLVASNSSMTFPFDGIVWPDEVFNLQSVTQGECL